eukprot:TRINITY_DN1435_c0_g1_i5.p1 TRINITY_DN1435_c0_g1~~TRINITY_DN1435_c0_g1_i5.p1  ORF type:complete len:518 (+),score=36.24 TRINITY_DN1435_c0_g1_i5:215-1768(+)
MMTVLAAVLVLLVLLSQANCRHENHGRYCGNVSEFGAVGDGRDDTNNVQHALDVCQQVTITPNKKFSVGPLRLRSNSHVILGEGSVLEAISDRGAYPLVSSRCEGQRCKSFAPVVSAHGQHNVTISGKGTIDGRGAYWWKLYRERKVSQHTRPTLLSFSECQDVTIRDIHLRNSPFWTVHLLFSRGIDIDGIHIFNPPRSPNTDGINPDSSSDIAIRNSMYVPDEPHLRVFIRTTTRAVSPNRSASTPHSNLRLHTILSQHALAHTSSIDVGDDCIAIKSGKGKDGRLLNRPTTNVLISHCHMFHGHGGVTFGSETSGGINGVIVRDCVFQNTARGIRLKTHKSRGGSIYNITYENIVMHNVWSAIEINMNYGQNGPEPDESHPTYIYDVHVKNVKSDSGRFFVSCLPEYPCHDITFQDVYVNTSSSLVLKHVASGSLGVRIEQPIPECFFLDVGVSLVDFQASCENKSAESFLASLPQQVQTSAQRVSHPHILHHDPGRLLGHEHRFLSHLPNLNA